jgi:hypothetical protein
LFPALPSPDPLLLLARRPLLLPLLRRVRALGLEAWRVGPRGIHGHELQGINKRSDLTGASQENSRGEDESSTHQRTLGEHSERPEVVVVVLDGLEVDGC